MKKFILGVAAASLYAFAPLPILSQTAFAGPLEDAQAALEREDYTTANDLLNPLAKVGNSAAQYQYGLMIIDGTASGGKNPIKAASYIRKAADGGHLQAQIHMSMMAIFGGQYGVTFEEQDKYTLMAAQSGDPDSQYRIGEKHGEEKNYTLARLWHEKAAAQGNERAVKALKELPAASMPLGFSIYDKKPSPDKPLALQDASNASNSDASTKALSTGRPTPKSGDPFLLNWKPGQGFPVFAKTLLSDRGDAAASCFLITSVAYTELTKTKTDVNKLSVAFALDNLVMELKIYDTFLNSEKLNGGHAKTESEKEHEYHMTSYALAKAFGAQRGPSTDFCSKNFLKYTLDMADKN